MSLEELRKRNANGKLDRLLKAAGRTSLGKTVTNDEQEETYYPERDNSGNGSCIIRFLPGLESEDYPYYIERFAHGFSHNNKWYIEYCPNTIGKECPACEDNRDVIAQYGKWDDCSADIQDMIRKRGRTVGFSAGNYCNILVIKDPANPENEGKIFKFSFGKFIRDLIYEKAQPEDNGLGDVPEPVDVFDLVEGSNFKFIIRKKDGRADYKNSCFEASSKCPEFNEDDQHALLTMIDEKLFKSYDELSERLNKVLHAGERIYKNAEQMVDSPNKQSVELKKATDTTKESLPDTDGTPDGDGDDNMAYFQSIADEVNI